MSNYWSCYQLQKLTSEQIENVQRSSKFLAEFMLLYPEMPLLLPNTMTSEVVDHLLQLLLIRNYDDVLTCYDNLEHYHLSHLHSMHMAADYLASANSMSLIDIAIRQHTDQQFRAHVDFIRSDRTVLKERLVREFRKNCFLHGDTKGMDSLAIVMNPSDALRKTQPLETHLVFQKAFSDSVPNLEGKPCSDLNSRLTVLSEGYLNLMLDADLDPHGKLVLAGGSIVRALGFFENRDSDFDLYFCGFSRRDQAMACLERAIVLLMSTWHARNHKDCSQENISSHPVLMTSRHAVTVDLPIPTNDCSEASHVKIQFITRLFANDEEVTLDFDQDICCATFDGSNLRILPRFLRAASSRQCIVEGSNHWRLVKYHTRGFDQLIIPGSKCYAPSRSFFSLYDAKTSTHDCVQHPSLLSDHIFRMRFDDRAFPYILWTESTKAVPDDMMQTVRNKWIDNQPEPTEELMQRAVLPQPHLFRGRTPRTRSIFPLDIILELPRSKIIFLNDFSNALAVASLAVEITDPRVVTFVDDLSTHVLHEMSRSSQRPSSQTSALFYRAISPARLHHTANDLSRYSPLLKIKIHESSTKLSELLDAYEIKAELRPFLWFAGERFGIAWKPITFSLFNRPTEIVDEKM